MLSKLRSVKNILLFWVVFIITIIVFRHEVEFLPLAQNLAWAVLGYFGANVAQKKIYEDKERREQ